MARKMSNAQAGLPQPARADLLAPVSQHAEHTRDRGGRRILLRLPSVHCLLPGQRAHLTCNGHWRLRHGRLIGASSRRRGTCGATAGTADHRADGSPPVPAASAQADATHRAAGVVSFGCAQGGVVSARAKPSTRWGCSQRGSVLPNVALRGTGGRATSSLDSRDYTQPAAATTSSSNRLQTLTSGASYPSSRDACQYM